MGFKTLFFSVINFIFKLLNRYCCVFHFVFCYCLFLFLFNTIWHHGRCYISHCFVLRVFFTVCHVVFVIFKCVINLTSFLFKSRFISLLLFIHLFFTFFFFWLSNFSHMKRLRLVDYFVCLFCFLSLNCRVIIYNFITFLPFPKDI